MLQGLVKIPSEGVGLYCNLGSTVQIQSGCDVVVLREDHSHYAFDDPAFKLPFFSLPKLLDSLRTFCSVTVTTN